VLNRTAMIGDPSRVSSRSLVVNLERRLNASTDGEAPEPDLAQALTGLVVLLVGRGSPEQAAVNRALKATGAVVLVRSSAGEMSQVLRAFVPSLVVTEIVPDEDGGSAVLPAIRRLSAAHGGKVPVIGICPRTGDGPSATRAEFQGLLADPFDPGDVARTVLRVIESSS
jgi:PleD family two-component response regulator